MKNINIETAKQNSDKFKDYVIELGIKYYKQNQLRHMLNLDNEISVQLELSSTRDDNLLSSKKIVEKFISIYITDFYAQIGSKDYKIILNKEYIKKEDKFTRWQDIYNDRDNNIILKHYDKYGTYSNFNDKNYYIEGIGVLFQHVVEKGFLSQKQKEDWISNIGSIIDISDDMSVNKFFISLDLNLLTECLKNKEVSKILWNHVMGDSGIFKNLDSNINLEDWDYLDIVFLLYENNRDFLQENFQGRDLLILKNNFYLFCVSLKDSEDAFDYISYELDNAIKWIENIKDDSEKLFLTSDDCSTLVPTLPLLYSAKKHNLELFSKIMNHYTILDRSFMPLDNQGLFTEGLSKYISLSLMFEMNKYSIEKNPWPSDIYEIFSDLLDSVKIEKKSIYKSEVLSFSDLIIKDFLVKKENSVVRVEHENIDISLLENSMYNKLLTTSVLSFLIPILNIKNTNDNQKSMLCLILFFQSVNICFNEELVDKHNSSKEQLLKKAWEDNIYIIENCLPEHINLIKETIIKFNDDNQLVDSFDNILVPMIPNLISEKDFLKFMDGLDIWLENKLMEKIIPISNKNSKRSFKF